MNIWLILTIVFFVLFLFLLFKKVRPIWKKLLGLVLVIAGLLFSSSHYLFPFEKPLEASGPHKVETAYKYFKHQTEFKEMKTDAEEREIPVRIWYTKEVDQMPLIIFSHGSFGTAESNESLFQELASHGYMVASLSHPHHAFESKLSDGKTISVDRKFLMDVMSSQGAKDLKKTMDSFKDWTGIRLEDVNFVVDSIVQEGANDDIFSKVDKNNLILSGHSLGGAVVLEVGRTRPELFNAVISLEAPFFGDITGISGDEYAFIEEEYPLPILHFYSDALWGKMQKITTYKQNQKYIDMNSPKFKNVHIEGTGHIGLTDMSLVSPVITNMIDQGMNTKEVYKKLKEINEATLEFLKENSK